MNRLRTYLLMLSVMLLLAGCWNRREVNDVAITTAMAIDQEGENLLRVTLQVLEPTAGGAQSEGGSGPRAGSFRVTGTGRTVFDALRNINQVISRRPEWKHNNAIILGEEVARRGVSSVLDFFVRDSESRLDQWILVAHGKAADALVQRFRLEGNQGAGIRRLNRNAVRATAKTVPVRLRDFMVSLDSPPTAPMAAAIRLTPPVSGPKAPGESTERLQVSGAALFRGDRLAGWLDDTETRGLEWLRGKVNSSIVVVPCQKGGGRGIGVEVLDARTALRPVWQTGKLPTIQAAVWVAANLGDLGCQEDLSKPGALQELSQRTAAVITAEIAHVTDRLQHELVLDPVGFGGTLERKFPAAWKQWQPRWNEIYPQIKVVPAVTVELQQIGTISGKPLPGR